MHHVQTCQIRITAAVRKRLKDLKRRHGLLTMGVAARAAVLAAMDCSDVPVSDGEVPYGAVNVSAPVQRLAREQAGRIGVTPSTLIEMGARRLERLRREDPREFRRLLEATPEQHATAVAGGAQ